MNNNFCTSFIHNRILKIKRLIILQSSIKKKLPKLESFLLYINETTIHKYYSCTPVLILFRTRTDSTLTSERIIIFLFYTKLENSQDGMIINRSEEHTSELQ